MSVLSSRLSSSSPLSSSSRSSSRTSSLASSVSKFQPADASDHGESEYPTATVAVNVISNVLAARICANILDHMLYLNGQIPFPVQGLSKLNLDGKKHAKAFKKRAELLSALDVLSSHLPSTFQCLSWAIAANPNYCNGETASARLAFITGPSSTTAKARCLIRLDGLMVARNCELPSKSRHTTLVDRIPLHDITAAYSQALNQGPESAESQDLPMSTWDELKQAVEELQPSVSDSESSEEYNQVETEGDDDSDGDGNGDLSFHSVIPGVSDALSLVSLGAGAESSSDVDTSDTYSSQDDSDSDEDEELPTDAEAKESHSPYPFMSTPSSPQSPPYSTSPLSTSRTTTATPPPAFSSPPDEELALKDHVRTVGLAMANGFDFDRDEIAPTLTHIMLQAPRRFKHPAWLPKQNMSKILDDQVANFFSGASSQSRGRRGPVEDGIRIVNTPNSAAQRVDPRTEVTGVKASDDDDEGANDLIWWQWNAESIRGFADI
ncbi:hypothetical protein FRB94_001253 [Tulasnella sp. JGI-2019a]|nr:hypothetical protein FRB93_007857 [Tulasnella sp. JGI-2019a]KAG9013691.1 hypothetical protein FRB94_001253 [Tulasnella sp. JGI-2019a]